VELHRPPTHRILALVALGFVACAGADDLAAENGTADAAPDAQSVNDGGWQADGAWPQTEAGGDAPSAPVPVSRAPCVQGSCWQASSLGGWCGTSTVDEDFTTGKYNVHELTLQAPAGVEVDLTLTATGGAWSPALILLAADGATLHDGELGVSGDDPKVLPIASGQGTSQARVLLTAKADTTVKVYVTGWSVVEGGFVGALPTDATYTLTADLDCSPPEPGTLLSPPNFDPQKTQNGFFLLPQSEPPGLYTRGPDACSWGNKLLIDVIYTVAVNWKPLYPSYSPISVMDLNQGTCGTHQTHKDGTHVDLVAGCATDMYCTNKAPKIALAKLFVDTGVACGIINDDLDVHDEVNAYFAAKTSYAPWNGEFMRAVPDHSKHFHVRVKKPDGTCN
jgi:hypothetical protein